MNEGEDAPHRRNGPAATILAGIAFFTTAVFLVSTPIRAQTYPDRPIKLIVPSAPGGPTDIPARLLSQILPKLGQPIVIENRPGAGGAIGARFLATSAPDRYKLLVGNTSMLAVTPAVLANGRCDTHKQFSAVGTICERYPMLVVHP